jgi:type I restriction enzyme S subunit
VRGWQTLALHEIADPSPNSLVDGPFGSDLRTTEYTETGVPLIRLQNVRASGFLTKDIKYISERKASQLARHAYQPGDIVITKLGDPCGVACIVPESAGRGIVVADIVRLRPHPKRVDHRYVCYFLNSSTARSQVLRHAKGTTRQRVNLSSFKDVAIPLPDINEQRRIAAILDHITRLQTDHVKAIKTTEALVESMFADSFGDPLTNPKRWRMTGLLDVFDFRTGKLDSNAAIPTGKYPFFTCSKEDLRIDQYAFDCEALLLSGNNASADYSVKHFKGRFNAYQRTYVITLKDQANSYVYARLALEKKLAELKRVSKGTNTKYLTLEILRNLNIQIPPASLQAEFADNLIAVDRIRKSRAESLTKLGALFASVSFRAFRGEL